MVALLSVHRILHVCYYRETQMLKIRLIEPVLNVDVYMACVPLTDFFGGQSLCLLSKQL